MKYIDIKEIKDGDEFDFGEIVITEEEAIEFAQRFDPIYLHVDPQKAQKGPFGRIILSGPHPFVVFHKKKWVPMFGDSVIGGIEISSWKYYKPIFPNTLIKCKCKVEYVKKDDKKNQVLICWRYTIYDFEGDLCQVAYFLILHML